MNGMRHIVGVSNVIASKFITSFYRNYFAIFIYLIAAIICQLVWAIMIKKMSITKLGKRIFLGYKKKTQSYKDL